MKLKRLAMLTAAVVGLSATAAFAEYPERPINMVIPFGAGGATDISARSISAPLGEAVGKPLGFCRKVHTADCDFAHIW